jgi:hypothetical protein
MPAVTGGLAVVIAALVAAASAQASLLRISSDPFTNSTSQHATEVEPSVFAHGSTLIAAFQDGRFIDGGASDIGYARSGNRGTTWTDAALPGITVFNGGGKYAGASDPVVAYDARHHVWMIVSLAVTSNAGTPAVLVSRSLNGGVTWGKPVTVANNGRERPPGLDKPWIVCDNTATSPYYSHCYVTFDDASALNALETSTSGDGGVTWGTALMPGNSPNPGSGGQPLVQPNGTVIVPVIEWNGLGTLRDYESTNGGASWTPPLTKVGVTAHITSPLRDAVLPSAQTDHAGRLYIAWQDCRFRANCNSNDIVYSTTTDGIHWTAVKRVPIDPITSTVDHFLPTLAVDPTTSGATAHLAVMYYLFPKADCTYLTCQLNVGYVSSADAGARWTHPITLAAPMSLTWLADTNQGFMVGDYAGMAFSNGTPHPVFANALPPINGHFRESIYTSTGLPAPAQDTATIASAKGRSPAPGPSSNAAPLTPPPLLR